MTVIQNLVSDAILSSYAGKVERPRTSAPSIRQLDPNLTPTCHEHNFTISTHRTLSNLCYGNVLL